MKIRNLSSSTKKFFISGGFNPKDDLNEARNSEGRTLVTYAVEHENIEALQELMNAKVDLNQADDSVQKINALTLAIHYVSKDNKANKDNEDNKDNYVSKDNNDNKENEDSKEYKILNMLLAAPGIDLNCTGGGTPLMASIMTNNIVLFERLLKMGAKPEVLTSTHKTSTLHCATKMGNPNFVSRLLQFNSVDVNHKDTKGLSSIEIAISDKNEIILDLLLQHPKINIELENEILMKPLNFAALKGFTAGVQKLLAKGANVNAKNKFDETPLIAASNQGHLEVVKLLLAHNAEVNACGSFGNTALGNALFKGHDKIVKELLKSGASKMQPAGKMTSEGTKLSSDIGPVILNLLAQCSSNAKKVQKVIDKNVVLSLCEAASKNDISEMTNLLKIGVDPNLQHTHSNKSWGALHYACHYGHLDAARLLIEHGADKTATTNNGKTPLQLVKSNHEAFQALFDTTTAKNPNSRFRGF